MRQIPKLAFEKLNQIQVPNYEDVKEAAHSAKKAVHTAVQEGVVTMKEGAEFAAGQAREAGLEVLRRTPSLSEVRRGALAFAGNVNEVRDRPFVLGSVVVSFCVAVAYVKLLFYFSENFHRNRNEMDPFRSNRANSLTLTL